MFPSQRLTLPALAALSLVFAALTCPVETVQAPVPTDPWITVILDEDHMEDGLYLDTGGDADVEPVEHDIRRTWQALRTGNGRALPSDDGNTIRDSYMQFLVDDNFMYRGKTTTKVGLQIEYLDEGTDQYFVQYDAASGGPFGDGRFKETEWITKADTGIYLTAEFQLCDAYFGNRDNGADFRISDNLDGSETVRRVVVTKLPTTINVDSCGANPYDDQPDSEAIQACIDKACNGDTIVFTSGVDNPDYQGYRIDKTIFMVRDAPRTDLTFTSSDPENHALLQATPDLLGFVVRLYARSSGVDAGAIDDVTIRHLDLDGNRAMRECYRVDDAGGNRVDGNWGSWLPECRGSEGTGTYGDPWCSPGTLAMSGRLEHHDPSQDYLSNPSLWSTGLVVQDLTLINTECGTALSFYGAAGRIDSVLIDTAGDHVHFSPCDPGGDEGDCCDYTDPDSEFGAWSDGITFTGPANQIVNNTIYDASDIGIVMFGGRDSVISGNTIIARQGNNGMFAAIAVHPWVFGDLSGVQVVDNSVRNLADTTCGGIHVGINIGPHMWSAGFRMNPWPAAIGSEWDCTTMLDPPNGMLCPTSEPPGTTTYCRAWGHIPTGEIFTLTGNAVTGAQVNYLVEGMEVWGELVVDDNASLFPRLTDWQSDESCWFCETENNWGTLSYVAHDPAIEGWTDLPIYCER